MIFSNCSRIRFSKVFATPALGESIQTQKRFTNFAKVKLLCGQFSNAYRVEYSSEFVRTCSNLLAQRFSQSISIRAYLVESWIVLFCFLFVPYFLKSFCSMCIEYWRLVECRDIHEHCRVVQDTHNMYYYFYFLFNTKSKSFAMHGLRVYIVFCVEVKWKWRRRAGIVGTK